MNTKDTMQSLSTTVEVKCKTLLFRVQADTQQINPITMPPLKTKMTSTLKIKPLGCLCRYISGNVIYSY